jgi:hypothetical protein
LTEETVGWIGTPDDAAPDPEAIEPAQAVATVERHRNSAAVGRIAIALVVAWTALVAIPGALPWVATDDTVRAIAFGIVVASVVGLVALLLTWMRSDDLAEQAASIGTAAAFAALGLAALEVVNVMILPAEATYRLLVTGIGLLLLIAIALAAVAAVRATVTDRFRISPLVLIGVVVGIVVVVAYLLMLQTMVAGASDADDAEWSRLTTLLASMQALVFAGLGALLGAVLQGQVTSTARNDLRMADDALRLLEAEAVDISREIRSRNAQGDSDTQALLLEALRQDPARFRTEAALRRWIATNRRDTQVGLAELADSLDQVVASARRIHAG